MSAALDRPVGATLDPALGDALARASEAEAATSRRPEPCTVVVFGASGDLAARKILPALATLAARGSLPDGFSVVGVARSEWSDDEFRSRCLSAGGGDANPAWDTLGKTGEEKTLLMDRPQHIKSAGTEEIEHEVQIALRISPDCGTTVVSAYEG